MLSKRFQKTIGEARKRAPSNFYSHDSWYIKRRRREEAVVTIMIMKARLERSNVSQSFLT